MGFRDRVSLTLSLTLPLPLTLTLTQAAERANPCIKKGVLRGHIKLDAGTTLQSVICAGCCILCGMEHECTIEQVRVGVRVRP